MSAVRGRYAPSPTGPLHLGNLRTALFAWLQARVEQGAFVMRMEDLDRGRTVEGSADAILDDLKSLGLDWDEGPNVGGAVGPYVQSLRDPFYESALETLRAQDLTYPCYCSRKEIAEVASAPHGATIVYPGTCANLSATERIERREVSGREPSIRFRVPDRTIGFEDRVCGEYSQQMVREVGDFVIKRADGLFAYQLAVVVDDLAMHMSDVVRGDDLLDSTPRQIALFEALGGKIPTFWHVPLMNDLDGTRLSKRDNSSGLRVALQHGSVSDLLKRFVEPLGFVTAAQISCMDVLEWVAERDLSTLLQTMKGNA